VTMKHLLVVLLLSSAAMAQDTITVTASPTSVQPGGTTTLTLTTSGTKSMAALQYGLGLPTGWAVPIPTISAPASAQGKSIVCAVPALICLEYGNNLNVIPNGSVATATITVPFGSGSVTHYLPFTAAPGAFPVSLVNTVGADPTGVAVTLVVTPATITVTPSKFDFTGDGLVTVADITAVVTAVSHIGNGVCPTQSSGAIYDPAGLGSCTLANGIVQVMAEVIGWVQAGSQP
jgi:hypothetical protein